LRTLTKLHDTGIVEFEERGGRTRAPRLFRRFSLRVSRSMDFICEAFDQMQRAFDLNGFNDHQLHCVLRFDSGVTPDAAILRGAVKRMIAILGVKPLIQAMRVA
jgi:hypothetical protein